VQQLRDGINNFFVVFIEVLKDRQKFSPFQVEPDVTSGDFLQGFLLGTRKALYENGRESITLTLIPAPVYATPVYGTGDVGPFSVGVLIALFERTVGLYAQLININAYHQPGVQAGKKAAGAIIEIKRQMLKFLRKHKGEAFTATQIAAQIGTEDIETVFKICEHLAAQDWVGTGLKKERAQNPFNGTYTML
jgi:glucose-6-phosphate isomerase